MFSALDKVWIRFEDGLPFDVNAYVALKGFQSLGVEVAPFTDINMIDVSGSAGLVGGISDFEKVLKRLAPLDYPEQLRDWLGRQVGYSTLGEVRRQHRPLFIKPIIEKQFTGFVWRGEGGTPFHVAAMPDETEIWVSDVVTFEAEYRAFIKDGRILDVRPYKGDWSKRLDRTVVEGAVRDYTEAPRGYSLDFGVTSGGHTLLVEANDGYALGYYGLDAKAYAELLEARWEEIARDGLIVGADDPV